MCNHNCDKVEKERLQKLEEVLLEQEAQLSELSKLKKLQKDRADRIKGERM
jgi:hypothetical protein